MGGGPLSVSFFFFIFPGFQNFFPSSFLFAGRTSLGVKVKERSLDKVGLFFPLLPFLLFTRLFLSAGQRQRRALFCDKQVTRRTLIYRLTLTQFGKNNHNNFLLIMIQVKYYCCSQRRQYYQLIIHMDSESLFPQRFSGQQWIKNMRNNRLNALPLGYYSPAKPV